jgi:hypothetical protein
MIRRKLLTMLGRQLIVTGDKMHSYKMKLTVVMNAVKLQLRKAQSEHANPKLKRQAKLRLLETAMRLILLEKQWDSTSGFGPTQPPIQWVSGVLSLEVKHQEH